MHFGVPVVPLEYSMAKGWLNGTCSNVNSSLTASFVWYFNKNSSNKWLLGMSFMESLVNLSRNGTKTTASIDDMS